jgi:4-hydroxybenzoate polyprenyltransferase
MAGKGVVLSAPAANGIEEAGQLDRVPGQRQLVLEHDIILSGMGDELFMLALREKPLKALKMAVAGKSSLQDLPIHPSALRYDWVKVRQIQTDMADGKPLFLNSDLPTAWRDTILAYLGLIPGSEITLQANAEPVESAPQSTPFAAVAKALRLHQWAKNILVFVPLIMAHQMFATEALRNSILAFLCFGLVASSIYVMNDLMDLKQDRRHPTKRHRPFASGALSVSTGFMMLPVLLILAAVTASFLPPMFSVVIAAYVALNLSYTFYLKRKLLLDVLALSGAYTLRILAGNAAGPIEMSNWLLAFSMFFFLSLALVKRYIELDTVEECESSSKRVMGRGYRHGDLDMISQLGIASGFAAVVVLALFIEGAGKSGLYKQREMIWLICPIVLYIIGRIWVLAKRREMPDDPIMFIIRDWRSHIMGAAIALILFFAV